MVCKADRRTGADGQIPDSSPRITNTKLYGTPYVGTVFQSVPATPLP